MAAAPPRKDLLVGDLIHISPFEPILLSILSAEAAGRGFSIRDHEAPSVTFHCMTATLPGLGWSSPIVAGRNIFLTTVTTDGKAKQPQVGANYSNDYAAELSKQGLKDKEVLDRLNARDFEFPDEVALHYFLYFDLYSGKTILDFGTASSPTLVNDLVIVVNDNEKQQFIAAFDKHTGKQVWRTNRSIHVPGSDRQTGWSSPYIWKNSERTEIVTIGPGLAIGYDLEGQELWRLGGMSAMPIPSPFAYDGLLYLNGGTAKALAAIKPGASGDLTTPDGARLNDFVAWLQPKAGTYLPTELAYDGGLYVLSHTGILTRFDAKTGVQSYKARIGEGGDFTSSPWGYNGEIFCMNEEGRTFAIRAGDKYELLASNDLGEMALATPALIGDRLILRTENHLYSIRNKPNNHRR
jgi:outer membrane protein assembly factor BamB